MAGFDTGANALLGIGQGTVQPQTNLLQNISVAQGVQNAALNNRLLQAQYDSDKAWGNALLGATDASGNTDYAKARATAAHDPAAAMGAARAMREQNASREDDLANSEAGKNAVGAILSYVGANPDQAHLYAAKRMAKAIFPGQNVDGIVNQIAQHPDGIAGGVKQLINSMQSGQGQQENVIGAPSSVTNGAGTYTGMRNGMTGEFTPAQYTHSSPSETQLLTPVTVKGPDGNDISIPLGEYLRQQGVSLQSAPIQSVSPEGTIPEGAGNYPWNSGRYEGAPTEGGEQSAPVASGLSASLSPGQTAAAEAAGHAAGGLYATAGQQAAGFGNRLYQAKKALKGLEDLGPYSQGTAGEYRNLLANIGQSLGMKMNPGKTATYDETNKYLIQMAMSQPGAQHSDQQLATALTANPSMHINNLAAQNVLKANIALDRRANAAYMAFHQKYPGTQAQTHADEWPEFVSDYTQSRDARAYMWDLMSGKQRADMWKGMSQKERASFMGQVQQAGLGMDE